MTKMHVCDQYSRMTFTWSQIRDCVEGSNAVKRQNEVYLPMPSGMHFVGPTSDATTYAANATNRFSLQDAPWYHPNKAYRAYLQRARFPDITAIVLRGLVGIADKGEANIALPSALAYLENDATYDAMSLDELYLFLLGEVLQTGKHCIVIDPTLNNKVRFVCKSAESNIDWDYENIDGEKILTKAVFVEKDDDTTTETIEYKLENGIAVYQRYKDGVEDGDEIPIVLMGKTINRLPIFFAGAIKNTADVGVIPILGISDIAIAIYRENADWSQAKMMTCNPTLFIYGITEDQKPTMVGSTVCITISNPQSKAEYPATDTSALEHIRQSISDLKEEAMANAGQLLGSGKKGAESAEALSIREAAAGSNLLKVVNNCSQCIEDALSFVGSWLGSGESVYEASTDFAENNLSPQGMTALVSAWINGAFSHDTLLDNLRDANIVAGDITNEEEKEKISVDEESRMSQMPNILPANNEIAK